MSDYETDDTLHESDEESEEIDEVFMERIRIVASLGLPKDLNGRRKGLIPEANSPLLISNI
jgi:hypothetical protein